MRKISSRRRRSRGGASGVSELRLGLLLLLSSMLFIECDEVIDIIRTSAEDRHALVEARRNHVEHSSMTRRTLTSSLLDQETARVALVQQTQLAVGRLLVTGLRGAQMQQKNKHSSLSRWSAQRESQRSAGSAERCMFAWKRT